MQQFLVSIPSDYYTVKNIDTLKTLAQEKQALLVDVREPKEYASVDSIYIKSSNNNFTCGAKPVMINYSDACNTKCYSHIFPKI